MEYEHDASLNLTAIKEKFEENGIVITYSDDEIDFFVPEMSKDGKKLYPAEGFLGRKGYETPVQARYVLQMSLDPKSFPQSSYGDAIKNKPFLQNSADFVKNLIYEATGYMPHSEEWSIWPWLD